MMFSSKSLTERNNDPEPYIRDTGRRFARPEDAPGFTLADRRPDYQHGKLPANRVLIAFRSTKDRLDAADWVKWGVASRGDSTGEFGWTDAERNHAHRVLTLLATLTKESN